MKMQWFYICTATLFACYVLTKLVRRFNGWYYHLKLRNKQYPLPPGDMGWPLIGNLFTLIQDFKNGQPDSFITNIMLKYGRNGIYKNHLLGTPSIIICEPEMSRRVLLDDVNFKPGYPKPVAKLLQSKFAVDGSKADHRHFRSQFTPPIVDNKGLEMFLERIEDIVVHSLEEVSSMKHPVELLKEVKKVSFTAIVHVFMGSCNHNVVKKIESLFEDLMNGLNSLPINVPGFTFHNALKAREKIVKILEPLVSERSKKIKNGQHEGERKDFMDILLDMKDVNGRKMEDGDISDLLIGLLAAGHESTATGIMWTIIYLTNHPHFLKIAKEEQEEILKTRADSQKRLSFSEVKKMVYLSKVINEMLRCVNFPFSIFREAKSDVHINGYLIPKGWRVLVWIRALHMNSEYHSNHQQFNPSRWDDHTIKVGTFLPFGAGSRLCPGSNLAKLEISVYLHHFLLNYRLERMNPECCNTNWPIYLPTDNCLSKVIKVARV
ncbi:unnamed protein product [Lathyrus oleraceus]|nr:beta-amyrin 11-oxidase-like [Pisum sativum]